MAYETKITVRFAETDLLGHVNNASYFIYFEQARIEFFNELGARMDRSEWQFILASAKCDFMKQAYFAQELSILTHVSRIGNKSFQLIQPVYDAKSGTEIARGESTIIYFDYKAQKSESVPEHLREKLKKYKVEARENMRMMRNV